MENRSFDDFDQFASNYDTLLNEVIKITGVSGDYFNEYKIKELKEHLKDIHPTQILDFGCGHGRSVFYMTKYFPNTEVHGVDLSSESIIKAKEKKINSAIFTDFNGKDLPYADNSFDIVFTSMVFHHIEHKLHNEVLADIYRVIRPGGKFIIFEHNPFNPLTKKAVNECEFDKDAILLKPSYTRKMVKKAGFDKIESNFTIFMPRTKFFSLLLKLEKHLKWMPIGAQYYVSGTKSPGTS